METDIELAKFENEKKIADILKARLGVSRFD